MGSMNRLSNNVSRKTMNLDIHLDRSDAGVCTGYLEVHVAEEILETLDIREYDVVIIRVARYEAAANAGNRLLDRHTGSH